jgi:hypothetical protein
MNHPRLLRTTLLIACLAATIHAAIPQLDVRTVRTTDAGVPTLILYLANQGVEPIDSLSLRLFVDSKETVGTHDSAGTAIPALFSRSVTAVPDLCQVYEASGYSHPCDDTLHGGSKLPWTDFAVATRLLDALAVGTVGADGRRAYAIDVVLPTVRIAPGGVIQVEVRLEDRSATSSVLPQALLDSAAPTAGAMAGRILPYSGAIGWWTPAATAQGVPDLSTAWSFRAHDGGTAPDTAATLVLARDGIQRAATNPWILVRRWGVPVWGNAPDGSGPGLPVSSFTPDSIALLPYAPIATPSVAGVATRTLDSTFVNFSRLRVNQAGYRLQDVAAGRARIRYFGKDSAFQLIRLDAASQPVPGSLPIVYRASVWKLQAKLKVQSMTTVYTLETDSAHKVMYGPFREGTLPSDLPAGRWKVVVGGDTSQPFVVTDSVYTWVRDAAIRFLGAQRSGDSSWFHGPSHMSDGSMDTAVGRESGANRGGWYDAGDYLKEPQTMASTLAQLSAFAAMHPDRDPDHWGAVHTAKAPLDGMGDLRKEARFGADFFLRAWKRNGRSTGPDTARHLPGMVTGIGDFQKDHGRWTLADLDEADFGTASRTVRRELGANTLADVAASLAFLSKLAPPTDSLWADTALLAAKDMYSYAKTHLVVVSSPDYNGMNQDALGANLGLAATALWWATNDTAFLNDAVYNQTIGTHGMVATYPHSSFEGGWFARSNKNLTKGGANQSMANRHSIALHAFARILLDAPSAASLGIRSEAERQILLTRAVAGMQSNLAALTRGSKGAFFLPNLESGNSMDKVGGDTAWGLMFVQQVWEASAYVAADAAELLMYADIARDLNAGKGGSALSGQSFPADDATSLALRQLDYILGQNMTDASLVMGIGGRNIHHPHHRGSTDEGSWLTRYAYRVPVGALIGGPGPDETSFVDDFSDYQHTETTIDASAQLLWASSLLMQPGSIPTPTSISSSRMIPHPMLSLRQRPGVATVRVTGLSALSQSTIDLIDASGRILSSEKVLTDEKGAAFAQFDRRGSGLLVVRVRSTGTQTSRTFVTP